MWRCRILADVARGVRDTATRPSTYPYQRGGRVHARTTNSNNHKLNSNNNNNNNNNKRSFWLFPFSWSPSKAFVWLKANAMALATYQFFLEASCTSYFAWLLLHGGMTTSDIEARMRNSNSGTALLAGLVDWKSGQHAEGYTIAGHHIDAETLSAFHTGHNIAAGLLPLQLVLLALTYPAVRRVWIRASGPLTASLRQMRDRSITNIFGNRFAGYTTTSAAAENTAACNPFGKQQRRRK
ncbi:uncharacterized protein TM35_000121390 [Trypanosoma theileri]|uniref:Uncharacterized protein n=1 Tax=Trypanosoma theileri TaxID=67003 RepID=A0A1X0NXE6_9TRYP|nr:uncharacterized protein TM35_000121390 [Trypanosoma theileri]ORC89364.1 hypothetical protein TM35_000121390 [Trypanosoma theileri]